jgi:nucleolar MIF4G domain-containing protein 1
MFASFKESHAEMTSEDGEASGVVRVKNIMNCLVHLFLFQTIGSDLLFDVIKFLLSSFTEMDIEVLIFVLHNIGLQLRKKDPASVKEILDLFNQKKNSYQA